MVFTSEKLRCAFSAKEPFKTEDLSKVGYNFVCASCNANYVAQTCRHLATTIDEHFGKDKKSHIYQHLMSSKDCLDKCSKVFFFFCFGYHQHKASIKNKRIPLHHMAKSHFKQTKAISICYITFFLISFSFVLFLFFVSDLFDFTV